MSASLVGSEMCIRDRNSTARAHVRAPFAEMGSDPPRRVGRKSRQSKHCTKAPFMANEALVVAND
eukprot:2068963-Alexandrium_andersonii.AAC.1